MTSIMRCVTSVCYAVNANGELTTPFIPSRGLHQGDPISPYLSLLCAEGLSSPLELHERNGSVKGLKNGFIWSSHLPSSLYRRRHFFHQEYVTRVNTLKNVLQLYSDGSGQRINLQKSSICLVHAALLQLNRG